MHKQRIVMIALAVLGVLGTFLPWISLPIVGSVNGTAGDGPGWITAGLFVVSVLGVSTIRSRVVALDTRDGLLASIPAVLAALFAIYKIVELHSAMSGAPAGGLPSMLANAVSLGPGLPLIALAGLAVPAVALTLRQGNVADVRSTAPVPSAQAPTAAPWPTYATAAVPNVPSAATPARKGLPLPVWVIALAALGTLGTVGIVVVAIIRATTTDTPPATTSSVVTAGGLSNGQGIPLEGHTAAPAAPPRVPTGDGPPLTFGRPTLKRMGGGMTMLVVEVTNRRGASVTCTLTATFKKGDMILATANGTVNDLAPGGTKTAQLMSTDSIAGYDAMTLAPGACF